MPLPQATLLGAQAELGTRNAPFQVECRHVHHRIKQIDPSRGRQGRRKRVIESDVTQDSLCPTYADRLPQALTYRRVRSRERLDDEITEQLRVLVCDQW